MEKMDENRETTDLKSKKVNCIGLESNPILFPSFSKILVEKSKKRQAQMNMFFRDDSGQNSLHEVGQNLFKK